MKTFVVYVWLILNICDIPLHIHGSHSLLKVLVTRTRFGVHLSGLLRSSYILALAVACDTFSFYNREKNEI